MSNTLKHLLDGVTLLHRYKYTKSENHQQSLNKDQKLSLAALDSFIAILYVSGVIGEKGQDVCSLGSEKSIMSFCKETMPNNIFKNIKKVKFAKNNKISYLQTGKCTLETEMWNAFIKNI